MELVLTELVVPFPIRKGGWAHMTMCTFCMASPSCSSHSKEDDVRSLPKEACTHQQSATNLAGKLGLLEDGSKCCNIAIQPDAFVMPNLVDKGGDKNAWLVLSLELQSLIRDFLVIREWFMKNSFPEKDNTWSIGDIQIFLKPSGKASEISDLTLHHFNVAGKNLIKYIYILN